MFDGLYHLFMVIRGMVYDCYTNITSYVQGLSTSVNHFSPSPAAHGVQGGSAELPDGPVNSEPDTIFLFDPHIKTIKAHDFSDL